MRLYFLLLLAITQFSGYSQYVNVEISGQNDPNEPSIAVDVSNPKMMLAAANLSNYYLSSDSGQTWSSNQISSTLGVWGDPVVIIDALGNYYFFHLSNPVTNGNWIDRIVCQKSTDQGQTWSDGTYFGHNGVKDQDKHWVTVDRSNNTMYVTWTEFDEYGSTNPIHKSRILFVKSTDAGMTWTSPVVLSTQEGDCEDSDKTAEGAVPTVGPNGEVYVAWAINEEIRFNKSTDAGQTWLPTETVIATQPGGWNYLIAGLNRCNGLPITICDTSNTSTRGNIYVSWSDQRNGITDTDIWLIKSTDDGVTWTNPKRINDDALGTQQFMTWLTVDQSTGIIYSVFYDRRNYTDAQTDVYLAYSEDGGNNFTNVKISETAFTPSGFLFFGDYTGIQAHNGTVRPIWGRMKNNVQTIQTALIQFDTVTGIEIIKAESGIELDQNYPNPVVSETIIGFKIRRSGRVTISVFDMYGREVLTPIRNQEFSYGRHQFSIKVSDGLKSGVYYYRLSTDKESVTRKMVVN